MANISDVAKKARVSTATVSRVLNGANVQPETKGRVLAAMKALDYRPNAQARSLTSGKTHVVGVLVPDMHGPFYGTILDGCQQTLLSYGYNMLVCSTYHKRGNEWTFAKLLWEKRVDGLLILTPREIRDKPMQELLRDASKDGFPIVVADGEVDYANLAGVWIDNFKGGYKATEHLLALGHRRIGLLLGKPGAKETMERYSGYKRAIKDHGGEFDPELVVYAGAYGIEDAAKVTPRLLQQKPTAIFATADDLAVGVLEVTRALGLVIPRDLSLIGYDDVMYARLLTPRLTTIQQPLRQLGEVGAGKLVKMITGEEPHVTQTILPIELVVRESTGPPK